MTWLQIRAVVWFNLGYIGFFMKVIICLMGLKTLSFAQWTNLALLCTRLAYGIFWKEFYRYSGFVICTFLAQIMTGFADSIRFDLYFFTLSFGFLFRYIFPIAFSIYHNLELDVLVRWSNRFTLLKIIRDVYLTRRRPTFWTWLGVARDHADFVLSEMFSKSVSPP